MMLAAAAAGVGLTAGRASATYTVQNTLSGSDWSQPASWSTGSVPDATNLVVIPAAYSNASIVLPTGVFQAYGITSTAASATIPGGTGTGSLELISADATSDGTTTAPMLSATTGGVSASLDIKVPIVFGNAANASLQVATFSNTAADNAVTVESKLSEFAGSTWGLHITGTNRVEMKGGNYFTAGYAYSGDTTIDAGVTARIYNNLLPHGAGRGNLILNGNFIVAANNNAEIVNGLNGTTAASTITPRSGSPVLSSGANDVSSSYDGAFTGSVAYTKVGTGTQTFTTSASTDTKPFKLDGGVLSVSSIANVGSNSGIGRGDSTSTASNAASLLFDGGTLKYTGAAASSDRLFTLNASGGGIDSSGTGPLALTNANPIVLNDVVTRLGEMNFNTTTPVMTIYMPQTANISAGLTISGGSLPAGTTVASVDSGTQITVSNARTAAVGSGTGAELYTITPTNLNRTFTLSGSNTGVNQFAPVLNDSGGGGKVTLAKSGAGTWVVSGANGYSGGTSIAGGMLGAAGDAKLGAAPGAVSSANISLNGGGTLMTGTEVTSVSLANAGSGYLTIPTVSIGNAGPDSTAAKAVPVTNITGLAVTNPGAGYTAAPTVTVAGGGGSGLTAHVTIDGTGAINSVVVDSPGSGYTSTPSLTLSSAGQTTAGALGLNGVTLTSLQLTNPGFDYNSPTISITGGSGTGATGNIAGSSTSWTLNANRGITLGVGGGGLYQTAGTTLTYGGVIGSTDPGPFTKSGAGTLTLTAPETYTGNTSVSAGTLNVASSSSLPSGTNLTANGTAHLSNAAQTIGSLNGAGSVVIDGGTALSVNGGGTFSGAISSGGSVTVGGTTALTLSGANTYTGATTVNAGATLNVSGSLAATNAVTSNGTTNFAGNTTAVTETQVLSSLAIGNGATVSITPSTFPFTPTLLKPGTTTYGSGAKIDITNNEFATTGTASGALTQIQSGQIFSSQTPDPNKAIGYIDLSGADAGKFEVRYTLKGDANLDGTVNVGDLGALATSYGLAGSWANGDFTQDGVVNVGDLGALATNYGTQLASGPSAGGGGLAASPLAIVSSDAGSGSAAVPEPSSLGLLAAAALLSQRRRRRRA